MTLTILTYPLTQQSKLRTFYEITFSNVFSFDCLGGYREGETPGPIPNPEAKPLIADNTAGFTCGNVGRCLVRQSLTSYFNHFTFIYQFIILFYILLSLIFLFL